MTNTAEFCTIRFTKYFVNKEGCITTDQNMAFIRNYFSDESPGDYFVLFIVSGVLSTDHRIVNKLTMWNRKYKLIS